MSMASWIIDQLVLQGVEHFCIAPGSRCTPLKLAVANHPKAKSTIHFDERGLGFFALGIGKATKKPVAVITTSGTAVANLLPSVMEAMQSHIPLILLTADRPHELRFCGANQTMDQVKLFANAAKAQMDLSPHLDEKATRSIIAQSVFSSLTTPPGPIHLNCPFQEPFDLQLTASKGLKTDHRFPTLSSNPFCVDATRGVILLGPLDEDPSPAIELAKRLKWPIFADLLSNANRSPTIRTFEWLLKTAPKPDFILHLGGRFISKEVLSWAQDVPIAHVSPYPDLQDPSRRQSMRIQSHIAPFCKTFSAETDPNWLPLWQELDQRVVSILEEQLNSSSFTEAHAIANLPSDRPIFFGNSMPIRLADRFFFPPKTPPMFANRGVSGIDGNIATIAGIAEGLNTQVIGFIGDQTALHDLNSLALCNNKVLLIISNNFGGGIFDQLPIAASPHLEKFFTASHTWNFENVAKMLNLPYAQCEGILENLPSHGIVELKTNRQENKTFLAKCKQEVQKKPRIVCNTCADSM